MQAAEWHEDSFDGRCEYDAAEWQKSVAATPR
jgi:hypothetical protein